VDIKLIVAHEAAAINSVFKAHGVGAATCPGWSFVAGSSYISYGVRRESGVPVEAVYKRLPELSEALTAMRRRKTPVRLRTMPLALEVVHPKPDKLPWTKALVLQRHDTMLTGRNYRDGEPPVDNTLSFDDTPHTLVVGTTGSGKTTLLRMMIASLALNTDPDMLRLYLVDPKGEDFLPFKKLPHKEMFAAKRDDAPEVIARVHGVLSTRQNIEGRFHGERVVLVIDELSQVDNPVAIKQLNNIMAAGRSKKVNVILATQYPTKEVIGKVDLSNLRTRFVGQITTPKEAVVAAGRGGTGADLLPGNGAFLRIDGGAEMTRLQAYWLDDNGTAELVKAARQRWGVRDGVVGDRPVQVQTGEAYTPAPAPVAVYAPQIPTPLTYVFREYVRDGQLQRGGMAAALRALYGTDAPTSGRKYQEACGQIVTYVQQFAGNTSILPVGHD
jgi:energy-coupling factor transporter ATP-binding protein EcfA2